jgi:hypothetical protein
MCPVLAPSAHSIRAAVKIAPAGLYGVSLADGVGQDGVFGERGRLELPRPLGA